MDFKSKPNLFKTTHFCMCFLIRVKLLLLFIGWLFPNFRKLCMLAVLTGPRKIGKCICV